MAAHAENNGLFVEEIVSQSGEFEDDKANLFEIENREIDDESLPFSLNLVERDERDNLEEFSHQFDSVWSDISDSWVMFSFVDLRLVLVITKQ